MRTISSVLFVIGCLALLIHFALSRQAPQQPAIPLLAGPFAVDGVAIGQSEADCRLALGEPTEELRGRGATRTLRWSGLRETTVTFDASARASEILGAALTDLSGEPVLRYDWSLAQVREALPDADEQRHTRPTGSGVISLSRTYVGSTLVWRDGRSSYSIGFDALGRKSFVRAEALR